MNKLNAISLSIPLLFILSTTFACDDKAYETAYLPATSQYVKNHGRQADTVGTEPEAHASNRERHDYALQNYIHHVRYFSSRNN